MKIMVDLDRVVFECPSFIFWLANHIDKKTDKTKPLKYIEVDGEKAMRYSNALSFFKLFNDEALVEIDGAVESLQNWNKQGFEVHFVSSRPNLKPLQRATVKWLKKHDVPYSKLIFACSNKTEYCKQNNIDVMVDDNYQNCKNAQSHGVPAIWLKSKFNENDITIHIGRLYVANNWREINSFAQLLNVRKKLNLNVK